MNTRPIQEAKNADLRGSLPALQRAAQRARELAARTGTELIICRNGVIESIKPLGISASLAIQEPPTPYGDKP